MMIKNIILTGFFLFSINVYGDVVPVNVIEEWSYQENNKLRYLSKYCLDEVKPTDSEYQSIRSLQHSAEVPEAKYRFTLAREVYSSEGEASKRENAILQPLNRNSKQSKLCDLRKAVRVNNIIYFVHTDVGAFYGELQVIFNKLVGHISKQ